MQNFIFDLYGTLVDIRTDEHSEKFKSKFSKYIAKRYGADGTFFDKFFAILNTYEGFKEPDIVKVVQKAVCESGGKMTMEEARQAALKFRKFSTHRLKLYRGVRKLLKGLRARGAGVYLLSNAQAAFTVYELKKLNIYGCFDGIELSSDFGQKKPSPDFFKHIVDKYNLNVADTVFTGNDISCDIVPAKGAKMYAVYIKSKISPHSDSIVYARQVADFAVEEDFAAVAEHLLNLVE